MDYTTMRGLFFAPPDRPRPADPPAGRDPSPARRAAGRDGAAGVPLDLVARGRRGLRPARPRRLLRRLRPASAPRRSGRRRPPLAVDGARCLRAGPRSARATRRASPRCRSRDARPGTASTPRAPRCAACSVTSTPRPPPWSRALRRGIDAADRTARPLFTGLTAEPWPHDPLAGARPRLPRPARAPRRLAPRRLRRGRARRGADERAHRAVVRLPARRLHGDARLESAEQVDAAVARLRRPRPDRGATGSARRACGTARDLEGRTDAMQQSVVDAIGPDLRPGSPSSSTTGPTPSSPSTRRRRTRRSGWRADPRHSALIAAPPPPDSRSRTRTHGR